MSDIPSDRVFLVGLPMLTVPIVQSIARKTGMSWPDIISDAILDKAKRLLNKEEQEELLKSLAELKSKNSSIIKF